MTVAVAPAPWPRAAAARSPWRFARESERGLEWRLQRNLSMSPCQLFGVFASLCAVSLAIALGFAWQGAAPVLAFAVVELTAVGLALLIYARHATDHEHIALAGGRLSVTRQCASRRELTEFPAAWVRVEPVAGDRSLIELSAEGRQACVGRYLRADQRVALAQELRTALRAQPHTNDLTE